MKRGRAVLIVYVLSIGRLYAMDQEMLVIDALGRTALHHAALAGDSKSLLDYIDFLSTFVDGKNVVNYCDKLGRSALHYAAMVGFQEGVDSLLQWGADPNAQDTAGTVQGHETSAGYTPLDFAAMKGYAHIVEKLTGHHTMKHQTLENAFMCGIFARSCTPRSQKNKEHELNTLYTAINRCCELLLHNEQLHPVTAQEYWQHEDLYVGKASLDPEVNYAQQYPVHTAVIENNSELSKQLIGAGAHFDICDSYGNAPIEYAVANRNYAMTQLLLNANTKTNINEAMWLAAYLSQEKEWLSENMSAWLADKKQLFELLLAHGADINSYIDQETHNTLLHVAVGDNQPAAVSALIHDYGARTDVCDTNGQTPGALALALDYPEVGHLFIKRRSGNNRVRAASSGCNPIKGMGSTGVDSQDDNHKRSSF
jgi:ankyrin repeat protein